MDEKIFLSFRGSDCWLFGKEKVRGSHYHIKKGEYFSSADIIASVGLFRDLKDNKVIQVMSRSIDGLCEEIYLPNPTEERIYHTARHIATLLASRDSLPLVDQTEEAKYFPKLDLNKQREIESELIEACDREVNDLKERLYSAFVKNLNLIKSF